MGTCLFCQAKLTKANRSKEHVVPRWIVRRLRCEDIGYLGQTLSYPNVPNKVLSQRTHEISGLIFGNVCKNCNNGWMSQLETDTKPLLEALWKPKSPTVLSPVQCLTLARWTFKTAAISNYSSDYKKIIPIQHIHDFNETQRLPANSTIDMAYCANGDRLFHCLQGGNKRFLTRDSNMKESSMKGSYIITLHYHHVMLRLAWTPTNGVRAQPVPKQAVFRLFPSCEGDLFVQLVQGQYFRDHFQFHFVATLFAEDGLLNDAPEDSSRVRDGVRNVHQFISS